MATTILFVDDEPDVERMIRIKYRRQLRSGELEFGFACNGLDALAQLESRKYDLIITDINMPEMSGIELLRELARRGSQTPVLVVSAYSDLTNMQAAMNAGAVEFLTKPLDFTKLERSRDRILRERDHDEADAAQAESGFSESERSSPLIDELSVLGMLAAGVVHDLRNPLAAITTFAKLSDELLDELRDEFDTPSDSLQAQLDDIRMTLAKILRHSESALNIVGSILDGTLKQPREIDLNSMISDYTDLFFASIRAREKSFGLRVEKQLDPELGSVEVVPPHVVRMLVNLLDNAIHALGARLQREPDFKPQITIETRRSEGFVELCIADNGPGIPAEIRDKIFERFFTTKPVGEGSGLGLHLVAQLAREAGGSVRAEDGEHEGARLVVRLPG